MKHAAASSCDFSATVFPANSHHDENLLTQTSEILKQKTRRGRRSDPRMTRAVSAKLENQRMSLLDALRKGGFVFGGDTDTQALDGLAVDSDGVTLSQRKNQLGRRIRQLRQRHSRASPQNTSSTNKKLSDQSDETTAPTPIFDDISDEKATPSGSRGGGSTKGNNVADEYSSDKIKRKELDSHVPTMALPYPSGGQVQVQVQEQSGRKSGNVSKVDGQDIISSSAGNDPVLNYFLQSPVSCATNVRGSSETSTPENQATNAMNHAAASSCDSSETLLPATTHRNENLVVQPMELLQENDTDAMPTQQVLTSMMSSPPAPELEIMVAGDGSNELSFPLTNQTATIGFVDDSQAEVPEWRSDAIWADDLCMLEALGCALDLTRKIQKGHENLDLSHGHNVERVASDLCTLGSCLYSRFSGGTPSDENRASRAPDLSEGLQQWKKGWQSVSQSYIPLQDKGFPVSLCILVSSLMDANDDCAVERYESAKDVEKDLQLMISDPCRYLFDDKASRLSGKLEFPEGRLYGREDETSRLVCILESVVAPCGSPELVLVQGYSGTGKSALVEHIQQPLHKKKGYFISGKFSELGQTQPMTVIFDAFNEYCNNVVDGDSDSLALIREAVKKALGSDANVLMGLIPNLSKLIGSPPASPVMNVGGREALNRLLFHFRLFVRAIASPSHPLLVFFDDLQWADEASLELIFTLICDTQMRSLLLIGCYRSNVVDDDHPLTKLALNAIKAGVSTSNIKLRNLEWESVNALISDALHLSPRLTMSLARIAHSKTSGNPLFIIQFLRSLCEERLLHFSASSRRWQWDVDAIQAKDIADNVVDLMTSKMLQLDSGTQRLLKAAACLGSQSEASILQLLLPDSADICSSVQVVIDEGLMSKVGTCYKFSHDQIQQAAYSLIPASNRNAIHLKMGKLLQKRVSTQELLDIIFVVVDQLQRGSDLIDDHDEKVKVAELFLMAGEKAMSLYAFIPASIYLLQGTVLLKACDWEMHYDLSLRLFSSCAEVQYVVGNYDGVMVTTNQVFSHAKCLEDKLRSIIAFLESNGGKGNYHDAVAFGLDMLAQLGEHFPSNLTKKEIMEDLAKTKNLLEGCSFDSLLARGRMEEPNKVAAMELLFSLTRWSFIVSQELTPLTVFRMVQLTLQFGVCDASSCAFAALGVTLLGFSDFKQAYYYGKLALSLLEYSTSKRHLARVYCLVYAFSSIFTEPIQASLPQLRHGYEVGMSMGDTVWGLCSARSVSLLAFQCGSKLGPLAEEITAYVQQMRTYKNHIIMMTLPILQAIFNIMDHSGDPIELTGEAMNQDELIEQAVEQKHYHVMNFVDHFRLRLAYLFGKYDVAADLVERLQKNTKIEPLRAEIQVDHTFYSGLVAIVMARSGKKDEWRNIACESVEKMTVWTTNSNWNYQHKLDLLNAEMAYLNGESDEIAVNFYDDAICNAKKHGFVHEQALACERAGEMCSEVLGLSYSTDYFQRAYECYLEWGAKRKAADVLLRKESLCGLSC